jgi:hypothetical protein
MPTLASRATLLLLLAPSVHAGIECGIPCDTALGNLDPDAMTDGMTCQAFLDMTEFGDITCPFDVIADVNEVEILAGINEDLFARGCCELGYTTSCQACPTVKINKDYPITIIGSSYADVNNCGDFVDNRQALVFGRVGEVRCLSIQTALVNRTVPCCECNDGILECETLVATNTPAPSVSPPTMAPDSASAAVGGTVVSIGMALVGTMADGHTMIFKLVLLLVGL